MLLQHFVLVFAIQLFTFCLLTLLSLVPEITLGLCPAGVIKVHTSGSLTLCVVVDGLGVRDPEEDSLGGVKLLGESGGMAAASLAPGVRWKARPFLRMLCLGEGDPSLSPSDWCDLSNTYRNYGLES